MLEMNPVGATGSSGRKNRWESVAPTVLTVLTAWVHGLAARGYILPPLRGSEKLVPGEIDAVFQILLETVGIEIVLGARVFL